MWGGINLPVTLVTQYFLNKMIQFDEINHSSFEVPLSSLSLLLSLLFSFLCLSLSPCLSHTHNYKEINRSINRDYL